MKSKNAWLKLLSGNQETTLLYPSQSSFGLVGSVVLPLVSQGKMTYSYSEHIAWFLEQNDYRLSLPRDIVLKTFSKFKTAREKKSSDTFCLKVPEFVSFWGNIHLGTRRYDDKIKRNRAVHLLISCPVHWKRVSLGLCPWESFLHLCASLSLSVKWI